MKITNYIARRCKDLLIISDIHIGGGDKNLDDFVLDDAMRNWLDIIPNPTATCLIIGGDFIDFAQTLPEFGDHDLGDQYGVTEANSLMKLRAALGAHPDVFSALGRFIARRG